MRVRILYKFLILVFCYTLSSNLFATNGISRVYLVENSEVSNEESETRKLSFSNSFENSEQEFGVQESFEIKPGDKVNLLAEPNSGFYFSHWEANGSRIGDKEQITYTMPNRDVEIVGVFKSILEPKIRIVSPGDNASLEANKDIPVSFEASSENGKVTRIELFRNGARIGTVNDPSNNFTLTNLPLGNHTLTARVTDERGATATSEAVRIEVVPANIRPEVQIISPGNGEVFLEGEDIKIEAEAFDSDGSIDRVEFFSNGQLLGVSQSSPYQVILPKPDPGRYELRARAFDDRGASTNSAIVTITVGGDNKPPIVEIVNPINNQTFYQGDEINIEVNASDPDGEVTRVEIYRNNTLLRRINSAPFHFNWTNAGRGRHNLTARAYDNKGAMTNSSIVSVEVVERIELPEISIVTPARNQIFDQGQDIELLVMFNGSERGIEKVEYYRGNTLIGSSSSSPYSFVWKSAPVGQHNIRAVVIGGQPKTQKESERVRITVDPKSSRRFAITTPSQDARSYEGINLQIRVQLPESSRKVKEVEYFRGNQRIGRSSNEPYSFTWREIPAGEHNLVARLTYEDGTRIISSIVRIFVEAGESPEVLLDYFLLNDEEDSTQFVRLFTEFEHVRYDIREVRFNVNGRVIGKSESDPFRFDWRDLTPGVHRASVMAIDVYGNRINSKEIEIFIEGSTPQEENDQLDFNYTIGPNPTSDFITIYFEGLEEDLILEVVTASMNGTITKQFETKTESSSLIVDFKEYNKGVYVLFLNYGGKIILSEKIIKN